VPHAPDPQVPAPPTSLNLTQYDPKNYAIRIIALLASAAGNWIVKSPPKMTYQPQNQVQRLLYQSQYHYRSTAPLAVIVALLHVVSAKSVNPVVPLDVGSTLVNVLPPAV
jgi:hypothetical protein